MHSVKKIIGLILCLPLLLSPGILNAFDYDHEIKASDINFQWKIDRKSQLLHVRLSAKTKGWLSVGFNDKPVMKGADFVIGYVKNGAVKVRDDFGVRGFSHAKDAADGGRNDVSNVSGSEDDGVTSISFTMPLNSNDDKDMKLDAEREIFALLAYGPRDNFYSIHKYRAHFKISLATGKLP